MSERRAYRFSPDCPRGRVFVGADAIAAAEADGWVDHPSKVKAAKPAAKKKAKKKVATKKKVAASDDSK